MNTNNKNTNNSTAILLANLKAQFQVDLTSYKQAVSDYMAILQKDTSPFLIIGVGTNGYLNVKQSLDEPWQQVDDRSNGRIRSVCTGIDGKTIYGTNLNNDMVYKSSWHSSTWLYYHSHDKGTPQGKFQSVAACPDGTFLGVGMDNTLYKIRSDGNFTSVKTSVNDGENEVGVAVGLDGSVFVCNGNGDVYKKNSYQNLPSQSWQGQSGGCCIKAMTIAPDGTFIGIGTDRSLYTKNSYTDLTTGWNGPHSSSCCVVSITTVSKPQQMVSIQSKTFWGKGPVSSQGVNVITLDDCIATCSTTTGCSGATFNPDKQSCWLRSGESDIGPGLQNDYAIVPETKKYLEIMKSINTKLNDTNKQILDLTMGGQEEYAGITGQSSNNHIELAQNYKVLQKERKKINEMLKKFDDLDESQVDTSLSTTQNYYTFILLSVIAVAIGFILYYFFSAAASQPTSIFPTIQQGGKRSNGFLFCAPIIILIVILFIKSGKNSYITPTEKKNETKL
jgi:hypothetical protein